MLILHHIISHFELSENSVDETNWSAIATKTSHHVYSYLYV